MHEESSTIQASERHPVVSSRLDDIDFHIISLLVRDGRLSFARIGGAVGLSPHGAADRVRRLREAGVITSFTALIDLGRMGRTIDAYIDVRLSASTNPDAFERHVIALPAVREFAFVTGRFDYQIRAACTDAEDLDRTVRALRQTAGAAQTETRIVMRSSRARDAPPLAAGEDSTNAR